MTELKYSMQQFALVKDAGVVEELYSQCLQTMTGAADGCRALHHFIPHLLSGNMRHCHTCWKSPAGSQSDICVCCMQRTLLPNEKEALLASEHRPNFILRIMTEVIWQADLMEGQCMRLDETLSFFEEQIGTCER